MSKGLSGLFKTVGNRVGPTANSGGGGSSDNEIRAPDTGVITDAASEAGSSPEVQEISPHGDPSETPDSTESTDTSYLPDETEASGACDYAVIGEIFAKRDLSVEDAEAHKDMLMKMTATDYENVLSNQGYVIHGIKKSKIGSKTGWQLDMNTWENKGAKLNGVFVHHAVASHGAPYVKFSTSHGKIKIVDNRNTTYKDREEKNTILIFLMDL